MAITRQPRAPLAVRIAGRVSVVIMRAKPPLVAGVTRTPAAGTVSLRSVTAALPLCFGNVTLPTNSALFGRTISSPPTAALSASCSAPTSPAGTRMLRPVTAGTVTSTVAAGSIGLLNGGMLPEGSTTAAGTGAVFSAVSGSEAAATGNLATTAAITVTFTESSRPFDVRSTICVSPAPRIVTRPRPVCTVATVVSRDTKRYFSERVMSRPNRSRTATARDVVSPIWRVVSRSDRSKRLVVTRVDDTRAETCCGVSPGP